MSEEQELLYETEMQLDEKIIRKMLWSSVTHSWRKVYYIVCGIIYLLAMVTLTVSAFMTGDPSGVLKALAICVVVGAVIVFSWRSSINTGVRRWKEQNHQQPVTVYAGFSDEGIVFSNDKAQNSTMYYADIYKVYDVQETWVIRTKAGLLLNYNAAQLSETDQRSVLGLLKSKNPKIKIDLKGKR